MFMRDLREMRDLIEVSKVLTRRVRGIFRVLTGVLQGYDKGVAI